MSAVATLMRILYPLALTPVNHREADEFGAFAPKKALLGSGTKSSIPKVLWLYGRSSSQPGIAAYVILSIELLMFTSVAITAYGAVPTWSILPRILAVAAGAYFANLLVTLADEITDREADVIVHPHRPLASGRVSLRHVQITAVGGLVLWLCFNALLGRTVFFLTVGFTIYVLSVEWIQGRIRFPGFSEVFTPIMWVGLPVYAFAVVRPDDIAGAACLAVFHYLADMSQDIPGGVRDLEGDRTQGVQTFAVALGARGAARVSLVALLLSSVPLAFFLYLRGFGPFNYAAHTALLLWALLPSIEFNKTQSPRVSAVACETGFYYFVMTYGLLGVETLLHGFV